MLEMTRMEDFEVTEVQVEEACIRGQLQMENWILIIEWDSVEGHEQDFRKEPGFREFFALVKPFFNDIQEMKHYESRSMHWKRKN